MKENIIERIVYDILQDKKLSGFSTKWANRESKLTLMTCQPCVDKHGTIVDIRFAELKPNVMAHERCKCEYVPMRVKKAGTATTLGEYGADVYLLKYRKLPDYYINKIQARKAGWRNMKGNLSEVLPNMMIGGDRFNNRDGKLPQKSGRIWYESDINYDDGYRNHQRILYSNDGLIFVSYDHYQTYYEIT